MTDIKYAEHASEGGHWYDGSARQIEAVPYATKEGYRKPTLRDGRKHDWCRGITSITAKKSRDGLTRWMVEQGIRAALDAPPQDPNQSLPEYIYEIYLKSQEYRDAAREEGSRIHAQVERFYQGEEPDKIYVPYVEGVRDCLDMTFGKQDWQAEAPVICSWGFGTQIDLLSDDWVINLKSKDGDLETLQKMKPFDDSIMQQAAERQAAMEMKWRNRQCALVYISRDHPGVVVPKVLTEKQLARGLDQFVCCLKLTFIDDQYQPSWARPPWDYPTTS